VLERDYETREFNAVLTIFRVSRSCSPDFEAAKCYNKITRSVQPVGCLCYTTDSPCVLHVIPCPELVAKELHRLRLTNVRLIGIFLPQVLMSDISA